MNRVKKKLRTMDDIPLDGKRVICRVDFNVTVGDDGVVDSTEDYRIEAGMDTIEELRQRRCKVLLLAHRGRPSEGEETDLEPIRRRLEELLKDSVKMLPKLYGDGVEAIVAGMEPGEVAMFPNVRMDDREMAPNEKFGEAIAAHGDVYVNEAFSVDHRDHTSVSVLPRLMMSCAGRRVVLEVRELMKLRREPERPYVAIMSGAKITTKVELIKQLLTQVDTICVGGQIANVFLAAEGKIPEDKYPAEEIEAAKQLLTLAREKFLLSEDLIIGSPDGSNRRTVSSDDIPADVEGLWDIGTQSAKNILKACETAKTVMWNGPVGKFEVEAYSESTRLIAKGLAAVSAYTVVGGGDTVNALEKYKVINKYDHVSVGGGAMIAFLEGKEMPGLTPLLS